MKRLQLEHALRAAKEITGQTEFVVIGSCSILGQFPDAPSELTDLTKDIDIYPRDRPEFSEVLNTIGVGSPFAITHGFAVDPVGPETALLPKEWEKRLVKVCNENTSGAIGWCLEVHDVAVAKLAVGRPKDLEFIEGIIRHKLANP